MIDIHSHILPGIDDGATTIEESMDLINLSVASGVTKIIATPHIHFGAFNNDAASIEVAFKKLTAYVNKANVTIDLAYAAEVRICPEVMMLAKTKKLPFLGKYNNMDVLLLEFPSSHFPPGSDNLISWLIANNICPLIAHPERNRSLWRHSYLIDSFLEQGCLLQVTAGSLLGDFGHRSQDLAWEYLESDIVHLIASDMHSIKRRPNKLDEAYNLVNIKYGEDRANRLCVDNPNALFLSNPSIKSFKENKKKRD